MGHTLIEKIIMKNAALEQIEPHAIVNVKVDKVMIHDIFIPFVISKFKEMGFKKVWDPDKIVIVLDHLVPATKVEDIRHTKIAEQFAREQGIKKLHKADGICHQIMTEYGYIQPGDIIFGTDSHTTTYGALGAFSSGIGYTEMAAILGTGEMWVKVPKTIKINIEGTLNENVMSKDIILKILGDLRSDGASYKCLEFHGSTVEQMSIASRMTISNMAVEAGAKAALFAADQKTAVYLGMEDEGCIGLKADDDSKYEKVMNYSAEAFEPVIACPSQVDQIKTARELEGIKLDQVFIGSCTNGRVEDLRAAAHILKGKKIAKYMKLIVTPASRKVYRQALEEGIIKILAEAGAIIMQPGCGLCCGRSGGILCEGERVLATNNKNFLGRMGSNEAEIYLASPVIAALSALKGEIAVK